MNKRWLYILLFISLAFNLAVLGSFVFIRFFLPPPLDRMHNPEMEGRGMGDHRMQMWQQHCVDDTEMTQIKTKFADSKHALMSELAKDPIDETKIKTIMDSSLVIHSTLERRLGQRLLTLRKSMGADEAKDFFGKRPGNGRLHMQQGERVRRMRQFNRQYQQNNNRRTQ